MGIRICAIGGSVRPGNYTFKALDLVLDELNSHKDVETDRIDPASLTLTLPGIQNPGSDDATMQEMVRNATGVILATPEYHGGLSSGMKLVIDNLGFPSMLAGKPVALLGVAAGRIGAIKALEQLRSICSHVGAIVLPGPVSVAGVQGLFDDDGRCTDPETEKQIRAAGSRLLDYIHKHLCPAVALERMVRGEQAG